MQKDPARLAARLKDADAVLLTQQRSYEKYYGTVIDSILAFAAGKPINVLNPEALETK